MSVFIQAVRSQTEQQSLLLARAQARLKLTEVTSLHDIVTNRHISINSRLTLENGPRMNCLSVLSPASLFPVPTQNDTLSEHFHHPLPSSRIAFTGPDLHISSIFHVALDHLKQSNPPEFYEDDNEVFGDMDEDGERIGGAGPSHIEPHVLILTPSVMKLQQQLAAENSEWLSETSGTGQSADLLNQIEIKEMPTADHFIFFLAQSSGSELDSTAVNWTLQPTMIILHSTSSLLEPTLESRGIEAYARLLSAAVDLQRDLATNALFSRKVDETSDHKIIEPQLVLMEPDIDVFATSLFVIPPSLHSRTAVTSRHPPPQHTEDEEDPFAAPGSPLSRKSKASLVEDPLGRPGGLNQVGTSTGSPTTSATDENSSPSGRGLGNQTGRSGKKEGRRATLLTAIEYFFDVIGSCVRSEPQPTTSNVSENTSTPRTLTFCHSRRRMFRQPAAEFPSVAKQEPRHHGQEVEVKTFSVHFVVRDSKSRDRVTVRRTFTLLP